MLGFPSDRWDLKNNQPKYRILPSFLLTPSPEDGHPRLEAKQEIEDDRTKKPGHF